MGVYRIDLVLSGKSQIQQMMNQASGSVKTGMDKIKGSAKSTETSLSQVGKTGSRIGNEVSRGSTSASNSLSRLRSVSSNVFTTITQGAGRGGDSIGKEVSRGSTTASASLSRLSGVASNTFSSMGKGISSVMDGLDGIGGIISGVIGGFGLMTIAQAAWTGSTQKQFNQAYLQTKMSKDAADEYIKSIQTIVAEVPGDDTFMNTLLTGAVARQTSITTTELKALGNAAADYMVVSQNQGKSMIETQMDLKEYIQTGNTSQLERDSILKNQMSTLEGQETVSDRILALNKALNDEGYAGLSQLDIATIKAEELKGKFQLSATALGEKVLPYIEQFIDFMLELDEKTGGLSTHMILIGGGVVALGMALGPVVWSFKEVFSSVGGIKDKLFDITKKKHKVDFDCSKPCPPVGSSGTGGTTGKAGAGAGLLGMGWGTTTAFAGAVGLSAGYITNELDRYFEGTSGKDTWQGYKQTIGLMPGFGMITPLQSGAKSLENLFTGKDPIAPIMDYFKSPLGVGGKEGLAGLLGKLLPGTSHASTGPGIGDKGKPSITGDIFGSKGILRGTPLAGLKWPTPMQILNSLKNVLVPKVPKLNWKLPNIGQFLKEIRGKINPLKWNIPSVGQLLGQTWNRIKDLIWQIPNPGDFLAQTWQKITQLIWDIPTAGQILGYIQSIIPPFTWPWGPGGGTRAGNIASNIHSRASSLLARGPPSGPSHPVSVFRTSPRGPLTDTVSSTIGNGTGLGQGNIAGAMNLGFRGVDAFNYIANGMSDHLSYEFYFGGQKSNRQVWDTGTCNCYDGAEFLVSEASRKMVPNAGMTNGLWDGTSIPHTWAMIGGRPFDMAAKLIRGHWNPPSGPGSFDQFMTDIGPGLEYIGYGGHRVNPYDAISQGGNCFDMTLGVLGLARELWGMPGQMVWGHYDGMSHVWARIGNKDYDPTRRALVGSYTPPPQGPGRWPQGPGGDTFIIEFNGTVYGVEDLDNRTETMVKQVLEKREKKRREYSFGL